jgi:hypothetical protein
VHPPTLSYGIRGAASPDPSWLPSPSGALPGLSIPAGPGRVPLDQELARREQERPEPAPDAAEEGRRLGRGSLEAKRIRGYGPYLYYRFREGGRHRSVYVGKAGPTTRG